MTDGAPLTVPTRSAGTVAIMTVPDTMRDPLLMGHHRIPAAHPWPAGTTLNAGRARYGPDNAPGWYVEAMPTQPWYFRAHAATARDAEDTCWARFQAALACPEHHWHAGSYTNGAGRCTRCHVFSGEAFTGAQLGQFCTVCSAPTLHARYSPAATWDDRGWVDDPGAPEDRRWYCTTHDPFTARRDAHWAAEDAEEAAHDTTRPQTT